jgi:hypothetical protein
MNQTVSANIIVDEDSLNIEKTKKTTGGLLQFPVPGKFIHFNTIEEYQGFTFNDL